VATWTVAGSGLVVRAWLERPELWSVVAALVGMRLVVDWPLADNHIYLLFYWVLVTLAFRTSRPFPTLARSARWLVGLTFLFAMLWKAVLAPEYLDGRFFRVTLLTDDRFAWLAQTAGGYTAPQMHDNRAALEPAPEGTEVLNGPTLVLTPAFERLALAMTWGGLLLESSVAILFLAPVTRRLSTLRHVLLCAFCFCTYSVAPIAGFGWLLAIMASRNARTTARSCGSAISQPLSLWACSAKPRTRYTSHFLFLIPLSTSHFTLRTVCSALASFSSR